MINTGEHIHDLMMRSACDRHGAPWGEPCWRVSADNNARELLAICGKRIRAGGYNGKISSSSLNKTSNKKEVYA